MQKNVQKGQISLQRPRFNVRISFRPKQTARAMDFPLQTWAGPLEKGVYRLTKATKDSPSDARWDWSLSAAVITRGSFCPPASDTIVTSDWLRMGSQAARISAQAFLCSYQ